MYRILIRAQKDVICGNKDTLKCLYFFIKSFSESKLFEVISLDKKGRYFESLSISILNNLESIATSNIKYDIYQIDDGFVHSQGDVR